MRTGCGVHVLRFFLAFSRGSHASFATDRRFLAGQKPEQALRVCCSSFDYISALPTCVSLSADMFFAVRDGGSATLRMYPRRPRHVTFVAPEQSDSATSHMPSRVEPAKFHKPIDRLFCSTARLVQ